MFIAGREMILNGQAVAQGQVLDGIWPTLRERNRRALLANKHVIVVPLGDAVVPELSTTSSTGSSTGYVPPPSTEPAPTTKRKRGRPKKASS